MSNGEKQILVKTKGLHTVKRKLSDGSVRAHHYAWRGGPKMKSEYGSTAFAIEFENHMKAKSEGTRRDTLDYVADIYLKSPEGLKGVEKTVSERQRYIKTIKAKFGKMRIQVLDDNCFRQDLYQWRDSYAATPRTADELWKKFNRLSKFSIKRGYTTKNPLAGYEALYSSNRADVVWMPSDIAQMLKSCGPEIRRLYQAAMHLGARFDDLRTLKWSDIKEDKTSWKPSKGKKYNRKANVPHTDAFRALIAQIPKTSIFVFINTQGQPWSKTAMKSADTRARRRAELMHLHFHDLRGTAATIMVQQGYNALQIAGALGWSPTEVESMLNRYVSWGDLGVDWSKTVNGSVNGH